MPIPLVFYAASASQVLPAIAGFRYRRRLPVARRWIILWGLIGLSLDAVGLYLALHRQNNHWVGYFAAPFEVSTILVALSYWQPGVTGRRLLRGVALAFVATVVLLVAFVESTTTPSLLRGPIESILIVIASLATLLLLARLEQGNLLQKDWFWICTGLALRYGVAVAIGPLARVLLGDSPDLVITALKLKAVVDIVALLLIARGIWCPVLPQRSSGPLSPVSSPSASSLPPSAQPW